MPEFDFKAFWRALSDEDKEKFAGLIDREVSYIKVHMAYGRKMPRPETIDAIAAAAAEFGTTVSREQVAGFFLRAHSRRASVRGSASEGVAANG